MLFNQEENPISELISDETYHILYKKGLLNKKSLRDYQIRKKFKDLRKNNINASVAIDMLRKDYPYLQFDTIRKIVYDIK